MTVKTEISTDVKQKTLDELPEVVREVAELGLQYINRCVVNQILVYYRLGSLLVSLEGKVDDEAAVMSALAEHWTQVKGSVTMLYDLRSVARTYTIDFIEMASKQRMSNGHTISWTHLKEMQKIKDNDQRNKIFGEVIASSLTANQTALLVNGSKGVDNKRSGGRKPSVPNNIRAAIRKTFTVTQSAARYYTEMISGVKEATIDASNVDEVRQGTEEALEKIAELQSAMAKVKSKLQSIKKACDTPSGHYRPGCVPKKPKPRKLT